METTSDGAVSASEKQEAELIHCVCVCLCVSSILDTSVFTRIFIYICGVGLGLLLNIGEFDKYTCII